MGDYSQVMHEEALVARIISQARAIYGPKYPFGSTFDVIYTYGAFPEGCVSWLIVYPQPDSAILKTGKAVSNDWVPLLKSNLGSSKQPMLQETYGNLIGKLRAMMLETMNTSEKAEEMEKAEAVKVDKSAEGD